MTGRDVIPTGSQVASVLSFPILEPHNIAVGDLLEVLTSAGLDSTTVNAHNAACGRFCFWSLKVFAEEGLIQSNWAPVAYEWHKEIRMASGPLGITLLNEDIVNL